MGQVCFVFMLNRNVNKVYLTRTTYCKETKVPLYDEIPSRFRMLQSAVDFTNLLTKYNNFDRCMLMVAILIK